MWGNFARGERLTVLLCLAYGAGMYCGNPLLALPFVLVLFVYLFATDRALRHSFRPQNVLRAALVLLVAAVGTAALGIANFMLLALVTFAVYQMFGGIPRSRKHKDITLQAGVVQQGHSSLYVDEEGEINTSDGHLLSDDVMESTNLDDLLLEQDRTRGQHK